ncbi:hypothetical protein CCAX7_55680 [Capsulimonas corticalis]|uniref:Uncharacterized protein n=1 Tax=Capsulimonas corticalis TaxID=2219043 RepID=A0A402D0X4_9BACT|nr:hypothetical protein [Capsulimonas corticalis]BDI33517.1 hypothetical protein CCAX7_55680 [Capsulimonas corticalis]
MKTIVTIHFGSFDEVGGALFEEIAAIYPEGARTNAHGVQVFDSQMPQEDERNTQIFDLLRRYDCTPDPGTMPGKHDFLMRIERSYSKRDLEQCRYLSPYFTRTFGFDERLPSGLLSKDAAKIKPKSDIGGGWGMAVLISERIRAAVEEGAFRGAKLQPIELYGAGAKKLSGQFWELTSEIVLPPLSDRNVFLSARGPSRLLDRDAPEPSVLREGIDFPEALFAIPELHYRAKDLASIPPFDIALTYENFGLNAPHTVFSQTFYQFCVLHKLTIGWAPVQIDKD